MKKIKNYLLPVLVSLLVFAGCENDNMPLNSPDYSENTPLFKGNGNSGGGGETGYAGSGPYTGNTGNCLNGYYEYSFTLWAGQHNDAGKVVITNDDDNLYVTYNTNQSADLLEVHLHVYTAGDELPTKRPVPGQAPYKASGLYADSYTVVVPFADLGTSVNCGDKFYFAAHASLTSDNDSDDSTDEPSGLTLDGETAYSGGNTPFTGSKGGGAWFYLAEYSVECCDDVADCPTLEWTLWAGQHNNAGSVTVYNDEEFLYVTYNTNESADLGSIHLRIDTAPPSGKDSPGRYNMNSYIDLSGFPVDSYTVVIPFAEAGFTCDQQLYISAHASLVADDPSDNSTDEDVPDDNGGYTPGGTYNSSNAGETAFGGYSTSGDSNFDFSGNTAYGGGTFVPPGGGAWFYYMDYVVCCN